MAALPALKHKLLLPIGQVSGGCQGLWEVGGWWREGSRPGVHGLGYGATALVMGL